MPTPVLRRDGTGAGGGATLRRELIAAPVPPGTSNAAHLVARHLGLKTAQMLRLALAEFIQSRANQLSDVERHAADVVRAAHDPNFRHGGHLRRRQKEAV